MKYKYFWKVCFLHHGIFSIYVTLSPLIAAVALGLDIFKSSFLQDSPLSWLQPHVKLKTGVSLVLFFWAAAMSRSKSRMEQAGTVAVLPSSDRKC